MSDQRWRHTREQVLRKLAEGHRQLAAGKDRSGVCPQPRGSESIWHWWLSHCSGMKDSDAKRLKELEGENARLRKLLAETEIDKRMLCELSEEGF